MDDDQLLLARSLGASIRSARNAADITLTGLAEKTELSQPFLSQIENGHTTPSVLNLHRIAKALGTTAHDLLERGSRLPTRVVRATESRSYNLSPSSVMRFCVAGTRLMDCNEVTAEPNSRADAATTHEGEEFVYVVEGEVRLTIDGSDYTLGPGDTAYYAATTPHQWSNDTDQRARFLFVGTPPSF
ncbi:helix-turn-helix domain-containing protein [Rhodococcus sp. GA1]|uniref:helix-turn-helix domain-containing protein n=1 Tax=Rhodococcus sp. GA1 TaxID=2942275 RepID=UPI0020CF1AE7|nr:XRE family transcriptional regulator [Rhodococcus sp. GA1]